MPCSVREVWFRVCEWSMEAHAACPGDEFGIQASIAGHNRLFLFGCALCVLNATT
jgi:hypothetical protein